MTFGKAVKCLSAGLILSVVVIGILPLLLVYSWVELYGLSELYTSPLLLINKLFSGSGNSNSDND